MDPCPHPSSQAMSQGGATAVAGVEQLEQLEAAFTRLVDSTADNEVKDTLLFNKDKLVNNEVVSTKALQGLTAEQLMACGLSRAAVAALKLVFPTPTTAGSGQEPGGLLQFPQTRDQLQARLRSASKFAADIPGDRCTHAATVALDNVIVTYAHDDHAEWQVGDLKQVNVHSPADARRRAVWAKVVKIYQKQDIIVLEVDQESTGGVKVEGAVVVADAGVYTGEPYVLLGQSTQAQPDLTSAAHGSIAATELDELMHIRGDTQSGRGESGGGLFAVESGKLVGVCVGNDENTKKSVIVPTAVLMTLIKGH